MLFLELTGGQAATGEGSFVGLADFGCWRRDRRKGNRGMRLFFSGLRKLRSEDQLSWVTLGLLIGLARTDHHRGRRDSERAHECHTGSRSQDSGHLPRRVRPDPAVHHGPRRPVRPSVRAAIAGSEWSWER